MIGGIARRVKQGGFYYALVMDRNGR